MAFFNSQPTNWNVDYSQDKRGEILGQGTAAAGGILGSAISRFAQQKDTAARKKAQEEAAAQFLMRVQGLPEKQAMEAVKGVGVENVMQFAHHDLQKKQAAAQVQAMQAKTQQAIAKAQQSENEKLALFQAVSDSMNQPAAQAAGPAQMMPGGGEMSGQTSPIASGIMGAMPAGSEESAPGPTQGAGGADVNRFLLSATSRGANPKDVAAMAARITAGNKPKKDPFVPTMGKYEDNTPFYQTSPQSVEVGGKRTRQANLKAGDEVEVTENGKTVTAIYEGPGKYTDKASRAPLYYNPVGILGERGPPQPNPAVFGPTLSPMKSGASKYKIIEVK